MPQADPVLAAGAVVRRKGGEVLLVHRPRYDDWSFPKGKLDPGEHLTAAAVREVGEETGLTVRLGVPLPGQEYPNGGGRAKQVHYWVGHVVGDDDVHGYAVNDEIDEVRWAGRDRARSLLTYTRDRRTLEHALALPRRSRALVVLRHAAAQPRKTWRRDDRLRPLAPEGLRQAAALAPVLAAYGVGRVVTSSSTRCVESVAPYAEVSGWPCERSEALTEEGATAEAVLDLVDDLLHSGEGAVLCTHRPVLPAVLDALGLPDRPLEAGGLVVAHHHKGTVRATESHPAP